MRSCHNCELIVTVQRLAKVRELYSVSREYELHVRLPEQHPYGAFPDGFELLARSAPLKTVVGRPRRRRQLRRNLRRGPPLGVVLGGLAPWRNLARRHAKGKEPIKEVAEHPHRPPTMRELCEVDGRAGRGKYFIVWISDLPGPEAEGSLKVPKVDRLKATLGDSEQCCKDLEQVVESIHGELKNLQDTWHRLDDEVLNYKEFQGFQLELERTSQVTYEFRYRITLERLLVKYPDLSIEEDPLLTDPKMPVYRWSPTNCSMIVCPARTNLQCVLVFCL
ncbi:hypothetical protein BHE74_00057098 [Ensete ventricosum]|nr:hypothetical protein BHE74_00057098 [Ensete ventricosum]